MSTVTRDELMHVFQQLQGQFSSQKQTLRMLSSALMNCAQDL